MKNIARHGVPKTGVNYNNKFILESKKCAKITIKKIELNYIMDNINYNNKFILESKNNININQYNENIKMDSKNNNLGLVSKNNLSTNYIMTSRKSILDRNNKNNSRRSKAPIKNKPSKNIYKKK